MLCFLPLLQLPPVAPFCTSRLRSAGLTWPLKNITFLALRSSLLLLPLSLGHYPFAPFVKNCVISFAVFSWLWAETTALHTLQMILTIRSHVINKHQWPHSTGSQTCPCHRTASTMFDRWCGMLQVLKRFFLSHILLCSLFWYNLIVVFQTCAVLLNVFCLILFKPVVCSLYFHL